MERPAKRKRNQECSENIIRVHWTSVFTLSESNVFNCRQIVGRNGNNGLTRTFLTSWRLLILLQVMLTWFFKSLIMYQVSMDRSRRSSFRTVLWSLVSDLFVKLPTGYLTLKLITCLLSRLTGKIILFGIPKELCTRIIIENDNARIIQPGKLVRHGFFIHNHRPL